MLEAVSEEGEGEEWAFARSSRLRYVAPRDVLQRAQRTQKRKVDVHRGKQYQYQII